jgi:hypothetical protein
METQLSMHGHQWSEREIEIAGQTYSHRQCRLCRRNFVRLAEEEQWRAASVGVLRFNLLDEVTDALWSSEMCPGIGTAKLMDDLVDSRRSPKRTSAR